MCENARILPAMHDPPRSARNHHNGGLMALIAVLCVAITLLSGFATYLFIKKQTCDATARALHAVCARERQF